MVLTDGARSPEAKFARRLGCGAICRLSLVKSEEKVDALRRRRRGVVLRLRGIIILIRLRRIVVVGLRRVIVARRRRIRVPAAIPAAIMAFIVVFTTAAMMMLIG